MRQRKHKDANAKKPDSSANLRHAQNAEHASLQSLSASVGSSENLMRSQAPRLRETPFELPQNVHKFDLFEPERALIERPAYDDLGELPYAYGARRLFLTARDPCYLFAYWDFTYDQLMQQDRSRAHDRKIFLQVYRSSSERIAQIEVEYAPSSYVLRVEPDSAFYAEIGLYHHDGRFEALARSGVCQTPREGFSPHIEACFVTIPFHFSFCQLLEIIRDHMRVGEELADALAHLQIEGFPFPFDTFARRYLSAAAYQGVLRQGDWVRKIRLGSIEISEIMRGRLAQALSSDRWALPSHISSPMGSSWSQPSAFNDAAANLNAALITQVGTAPSARLRVQD